MSQVADDTLTKTKRRRSPFVMSITSHVLSRKTVHPAHGSRCCDLEKGWQSSAACFASPQMRCSTYSLTSSHTAPSLPSSQHQATDPDDGPFLRSSSRLVGTTAGDPDSCGAQPINTACVHQPMLAQVVVHPPLRHFLPQYGKCSQLNGCWINAGHPSIWRKPQGHPSPSLHTLIPGFAVDGTTNPDPRALLTPSRIV